jgi:hypothetical protein
LDNQRALLPYNVCRLRSLQVLVLNAVFGGRDFDKDETLSSSVSSLVDLRVLELPRRVTLCSTVTRLLKLTRLQAQWEGGAEHRQAVQALVARGVRFDSL